MDPIDAFRTLSIDIQLKDRLIVVQVPFTVELLQRVEQAVIDGQGLGWFRSRKGEKSILKVFEEFCKPYLPADLDLQQTQPNFAALFFACSRRTHVFDRSLRALHERYGRVAKQYGRKDDGRGPDMRPTTGLLLTLFGLNQPLSDALSMPCDTLLEIVESKLDESLSYLEGDGPRLARTVIAAEKEYGSVGAYRDQLMAIMRQAPEPPEAAKARTIRA